MSQVTKTRWANLATAFKNKNSGYTVHQEGLPDSVVNGVEMKAMPMHFQIFPQKTKDGKTILKLKFPLPGGLTETVDIEPEIVIEEPVAVAPTNGAVETTLEPDLG